MVKGEKSAHCIVVILQDTVPAVEIFLQASIRSLLSVCPSSHRVDPHIIISFYGLLKLPNGKVCPACLFLAGLGAVGGVDHAGDGFWLFLTGGG